MGVRSLTDQEAIERAFVCTYDPSSECDPWTLKTRYQRVRDYCESNPTEGSYAVASALELPRSQIRPWVDGDAVPDCVRGLERLREVGWIPTRYDRQRARGLNALVALQYGAGYINSLHSPRYISSSDAARHLLFAIEDCLSLTFRVASSDPVPELEPRSDQRILGRLLAALGVPVGEKTDQSVRTLPTYLDHAPEYIRRDWLQMYARLRGDFDGDAVRLDYEWAMSFHVAVGNLIGEIFGYETVTLADDAIVVRSPVAELLYSIPDHFGPVPDEVRVSGR